MTTVALKEAEARLAELLGPLARGEEVTLTVNDHPYAKLTKLAPAAEEPGAGKAGCYRKDGFWMAPDFDAPLADFRESTG